MIRIFTLKFYLILFLVVSIATMGSGQTKTSMVVGSMVTKPDAILILNPTNGDQGLLLPQVTTSNRLSIIPTPSEDGLVVFDITEKSFYYWSDGNWIKGLGNTSTQTLTYDASSANLIFNGTPIALSTLKEIPDQTGQAGKYLTTDGTNLTWVTISNLGNITAVAAGNGLTGGGTSGNLSLAVNSDNATITLNTSGQLQVGDGAVTVIKMAPGANNTVLTTNASGQVQWTAPAISPDNQTLTLGSSNALTITNGNVVDLDNLTTAGDVTGPINNLAIKDAAITDAKIATSGITPAKVNSSFTDGEVLTTVGGIAKWASLPVFGTVTNVSTGTGLNGGPISTTGTLSLANTAVTPGSYGTGTKVAQLTIDQQGRITNATNVTITGAAPTGAASGDLAGNFPNPTVALAAGNNIVNSINNVGTSGTINANRLNPSTTNGQVLTTSGGATSWQSLPSFVTNVSTGTGLSGGPITNTGTISLANTTVTPGSYGTSTKVAQLTIDQQGRITGATDVTITGAAPTGAAGGDLTGSFPNPTVAPAAGNNIVNSINNVSTASTVNSNRLASNVVLDNEPPAAGDITGNFLAGLLVNNNAITDAKIASGITASKLSPSTTNGQVLTTSGGSTIWQNLPTSVTSISTGTGLTGGPITSSGTISLANTSVALGSYGSSTQVPQFTVDQQGRITNAGNVTISGVAPSGAAGGDLTGTYPNPSVAAAAITTLKISDGAVTSAKLANTAVSPSTYGSATQVAQFAVDAQGRITNATNVAITGAAPTGTASGDLSGSYPAPTIASAAGPDIATAINNTAGAGSISGSKINANFGTQNISTSGTVSITGSGSLNVAGATTLTGNLSVNGTTNSVGLLTLGNGMNVTGTATVNGNLIVNGPTRSTGLLTLDNGMVLTGSGGVTIASLAGSGTNMVVTYPSGVLGIQALPATITKGDLTSGNTAITIAGGNNAVLGSGASINIQNATTSQPGILTSTDFTTFNNKVGATTAASGDITGNFSSGFQVTGLQNVNVSATAPADQQVLIYDQGTSQWKPTTVVGVSAPVSFKVTKNSPQTVLFPIETAVNWDGVQYNVGGGFSGNSFHVPTSALYHFDVIVTVSSMDHNDNLDLYLQSSVTGDIQHAIGNTGSNNGDVSASISTDYKAAAGETISVSVQLTSIRTIPGSQSQTQFSGRKIY